MKTEAEQLADGTLVRRYFVFVDGEAVTEYENREDAETEAAHWKCTEKHVEVVAANRVPWKPE